MSGKLPLEYILPWPGQSNRRAGLSIFFLLLDGKKANCLTLPQISNWSNQNDINLGVVDNPTECPQFPSLPDDISA